MGISRYALLITALVLLTGRYRPVCRGVLVLYLLCGALLSAAVAEVQIPALTHPVEDSAGIIPPQTEQQIEAALAKLWERRGTQLAVLTLPTLENEPIEELSIRVVEKWQLGTKTGDKGVLLLIVPQERQLRIEVGQGLEGDLPDAYAKRIIDNSIVPLFRAGDMTGGVLVGIREILLKTDPDFSFDEALASSGYRSAPSYNLSGILFFVAMFIFYVYFSNLGLMMDTPLGRYGSRRRGYYSPTFGGRGSSGGGFRGGGFSGGGFSGGGGGFSGGGASGRW
jgi:uncharacterized protein